MTARLLPAADRSPRAFALYRSLVEESNRKPVTVHTHYELTEPEMTWDELTAYEARAFGIAPALLNALVWAHERYVGMTGTCDAEFYELRQEERDAYPDLFKGEAVYSMDDAAEFMAVACLVPYAQAVAWVCRNRIQYVRRDLFYPDAAPSPAWLYGDVPSSADAVTKALITRASRRPK